MVPDLAFSLSFPLTSEVPVDRLSPRIVGLNPLPLYAEYWYTTDSTKYEAYVTKLAGFSDWLVSRGYELRFIPTQLLVDPAVIDDVKQRMRFGEWTGGRCRITEPSIGDLDSLIQALSELDIMVATLGMDYLSRYRRYSVEGDTFEISELEDRFTLLEASVSAVTKSLQERVPGLKEAVQDQYREIFRAVE